MCTVKVVCYAIDCVFNSSFYMCEGEDNICTKEEINMRIEDYGFGFTVVECDSFNDGL